VSLQVRLDSKRSVSTRLLFCTAGILLQDGVGLQPHAQTGVQLEVQAVRLHTGEGHDVDLRLDSN
jgi:hypothetical protein